MAQALTLTDAQLKRALRYCATRKHRVRDKTILLLAMNTGLRAKEVAALRFGDVFDEEQKPRTQFTLSKSQTKGSRTRTVFVNKQLAQALAEYQQHTRRTDATAPLFRSQKGGTLVPTQCVSCFSTYSTHVDCKVPAVTVLAERLLRDLQTKA